MSLKKNIVVVYGTQILSIAITLISSIFLSRILGPEGRGEQALFSNSLGFAVLFFGMSIQSTVTYFLNSGKITLEKLFYSLLLFALTTATLLGITMVIMSGLGILTIALPQNYLSYYYIFLFVLNFFFNTYSAIVNTFLVSKQIFRIQNLLLLIPHLSLLIFYSLIYFNVLEGAHFRNFNLVVHSMLFTNIGSCLIMLLVFKKKIAWPSHVHWINRSEITMFMKYSLLAYAGNVAQFLSYRLDIWTVDKYCGKTQLGIYSQAVMLLQMIWVLPNTLASLVYSFASAHPFEEVKDKCIQMLRISFYASFILVIGLVIASTFIVPILYGEGFTPTIKVIYLLAFGYLIFCVPTTASAIFAAYGHFKLNAYISISISIISSILYFVLTKNYKVAGAAVASNISYLLTTLLCFYFLKSLFKVPLTDIFRPEHVLTSIKKMLKK